MNREERIEAWKRELERVTIQLRWGLIKLEREYETGTGRFSPWSRFKRATRRYISYILNLILWPILYPYWEIKRRIIVRRIKRQMSQAVREIQRSMIETVQKAHEILDELRVYDFEQASRDFHAALFSSYTPLWSVKETGQTFNDLDLEFIFSKWRIRFNTQ